MSFDVGSIVAHLTLDQKQWQQAIATVKKDQESLAGYVLRNEQNFEKFGRRTSIVGAAVEAAFGAIVKKAADSGDEMNSLALKTGINTEALSAYKLAADKADLSMGEFAVGMKGLAQSMVEANSKGSDSDKMFKALGISTKTSDGKLRSMDQVLLDVADRFSEMPDGAEKATLAVKLFGKSGMSMIEFLNQGKAGLQENIDKARKFGLVISSEAAKAGDQFNDTLTDLKASLAGVTLQIGNSLLPWVKSLVERITENISNTRQWIAAHSAAALSLSKAAVAAGVFSTAIGPILIALPSLYKGSLLLGVGLGKLSLAVAAAGAAYAAVEFLRKNVFKDHSDQVDALTKKWNTFIYDIQGGWSSIAEAAAAAQNNAVGKTVTSVEQLNALWHKYQENTRETFEAILHGTEGPGLQELFEKLYGGQLRLGGILPEVNKEAEKLKPTFTGVAEATKTLAEELGYMTKTALEEKINKLNKCWQEYGKSLPVEEQERLKKEIADTVDKLDPQEKLNKLNKFWQEYGKSLPVEEQERLKKEISDTADKLDPLPNLIKNMMTATASASAPTSEFFLDLVTGASEAKKELSEMVDEWNSSLTEIGNKIASTDKKISKDTKSTANTFSGAWETALGNAMSKMVSWGESTKSILGNVTGIFGEFMKSMISGLELLAMKEMWEAEKTVAAEKIKAAARAVSKVFESIPFPLNLAVAAAAFAAVNALFTKLFKWEKGFEGWVTEPTLALVGERGPEYVSVTPEAKMARQVSAATSGMTLQQVNHYNISAMDSSSFKTYLRRNKDAVQDLLDQGKLSVPVSAVGG